MLKKIIVIAVLLLTQSVVTAAETIPDTTIIKLYVYDTWVVVVFSPDIPNNQNCSSGSTNRVRLDFADDPDKAMMSTLLSAAAAKNNVGFGVSGCTGAYPQVYRVDVDY